MAARYPGIVKLSDDRYEIRVRTTCPRTGRRKEVRRWADNVTIKQARERQAELRRELEARVEVPGGARVRLKDFAPSWLRGRIAAGKLKAASADKIASVWDLHIAPAAIADLHVDAITATDVDAWLDALRAKRYVPGKGAAARRRGQRTQPYAGGAIRGFYRVLRSIIAAATARARLPNPCDGVDAPAATARTDNFLTAVELGNVLAQVEKKSPAWYPAVLLDVLTGLRWGELSALRWDDVDQAAGVIRVSRGNYKGTLVPSLKTGKPKVVPLVPAVADALRAHRRRLVADQHPGLRAGWIFPAASGELHRGSPLRTVLDAACAAAELGRRVTPHGLRHTANDLLRRVATGEVTRAILGHATAQMTHHYSHVDEGEKHAAAARVLAVVRGGADGVKTGVDQPAAVVAPPAPKTKNPAVTRGSTGGAARI